MLSLLISAFGFISVCGGLSSFVLVWLSNGSELCFVCISNMGGVACSVCWMGGCSEGEVTLSGIGGEKFSETGCDGVTGEGVVSLV